MVHYRVSGFCHIPPKTIDFCFCFCFFSGGHLTRLKPCVSCSKFQLKSLLNYLFWAFWYLHYPCVIQGTNRFWKSLCMKFGTLPVALSFPGCSPPLSGCYRNPKLFFLVLQGSKMPDVYPRYGADCGLPLGIGYKIGKLT